MDHEVVLARSLAAVFEQLAAPQRLSDWLPEVAAGRDAAAATGIGAAFGLRLCRDGRETSGIGELTAYEPPWCVTYRLIFGSRTYVLRVTCANIRGATRVSVSQAGPPPSLVVDLGLLYEAGPQV